MPEPSKSPKRVRFGAFELDCMNGELLRDGTSVKLQPQPTKVLTLLVSRAGEIVTRQELYQQVWNSQTFVDFEQGLNFAIRQIRAVLADDADHSRFLQTIPRRGYRFVAPGTQVDSSPPLAPPTQSQRAFRYASSLLAVVAVAVILAFSWGHFRQRWRGKADSRPIESLAVLPLRNLSQDPEQEYFSDGMTDELITDLAKLGEPRVISHTSVVRYKGTKLTVREIAQELGVDAVIEGTVMRSGDRVRITAQLIDARSDQHLWAESYERDLKDILALQNEVAQRIASEVGVGLTANDQARLANHQSVDPVTYELYLKGNVYAKLLTCDGWAKGLDYFRKAIARDADYAPAYLGAGNAYFDLGDSACWPQADAFAKSRSAALEAMRRNPSLGEAHTLLGRLAFYHDWDWPNAEKEYLQGIELNRNNTGAHAAYAVFLLAMGRQEQGLAEMNKARQLDPVSEHTNMLNIYILYLAHRYDQSIDQAKKTLELYPRSGASYYWLGQAYERKGMYGEAMSAYMTSGSFGGGATHEWMDSSRRAFQQGGIVGYWQRQSLEKRNQDPVGTCWKSMLYAHMGDKEQALEWLNWGYQHHCDGLQFLKVEPIYDSVHNDSRFKDLITRLRL